MRDVQVLDFEPAIEQLQGCLDDVEAEPKDMEIRNTRINLFRACRQVWSRGFDRVMKEDQLPYEQALRIANMIEEARILLAQNPDPDNSDSLEMYAQAFRLNQKEPICELIEQSLNDM